MKFIYFLFSLTFCFQYKDLLKKNMNQIADELTNGSLFEGRLSINDVENLFSELINSTKIVHQEKIGSTYQGRDILSYSLCYNFTHEKPKILITSLHHSREVASLQMNIYLFLHIVQEVLQQKNPFYINFIYQNCITIVPFVNLDGYAEIEREFPSNSMPLTRKNLNRTKQCQPHQNGGVDLNRNYGYYFAYNNEGSSDDPCDECYRGAFAFSEKETQAIKYVVENFNIKMAMNLHCFGNLWVVPYSYQDETLDEKSIPKLIYDDFKKNGEFKGHYKIGNAFQLVGYTANGEAADWMLSQGVIAISPELGEQVYSNFFNNFYPDKENTLKLFQTELSPLLHFIRYLPFQPNIETLNQLSLSKIKMINKNFNNSHYALQVICRNQGVGTGEQNNIIISDSIKVFQVYHSIYAFDHEFDNENIDIKNLLSTEIIGNTIPAINFPARSSIIYYIILQQLNDTQNELKIYFDLFQGEINATTFTLVEQFNDEKQSENMYQHLYQLLYVGVAISIVLIILHTLDKKHNKKEQNITELIEQKPENVELKIQL